MKYMADKEKEFSCIARITPICLNRYHDTVIEVLRRLLLEALDKLSLLLDKMILICEDTDGQTECIMGICMAEHEIDVKTGISKPVKFNKWILILSEHRLKKLSKLEKIGVIIHELAYIIFSA